MQEKFICKKYRISKVNFDRVTFFIVLLMIFIMGLQNIYSSDLGTHLQSAKWMIEHLGFMRQDEFSYTSTGNTYYDLQWLYQLFIYGLYISGMKGLLVITNSFLIVISIALVQLRLKQTNIKRSNLTLFTILVIFGMQGFSFEIRPQVISFICLNLVLLVLDLYRKQGKNKLFFLPLIMLFWVNSHSLFFIGLVVIAIYILGDYLENKQINKTLIKFSAFSLLACFINPFFIEGLLYPLSQFGIISGDSLNKNYITELRPTFTLKDFRAEGWEYLTNPLFYMQVYALASIIAGAMAFLKKHFTDALLIIAFFILLFFTVRNYGFFLIVTLPIVSVHLLTITKRSSNLKVSKKQKVATITRKLYARLNTVAVIASLYIAWICITDGYNILRNSSFRFGISDDKGNLPVEATAFLNENYIHGKILNHLDFGGYLSYHYPRKVFIDGRLEIQNSEFSRKYYLSLTSDGFPDLLSEYDPDIIIFPYMKTWGWLSHLIGHQDFRLVYFDGIAAVYIKNGKFQNISALNEVSVKQLAGKLERKKLGALILEDKPAITAMVFKSLWQKQYFPLNEQNRAAFCFTNNYTDAGLSYLAQGLQKSTVNTPNIFRYLSLYFKDIGQYNEANICKKRAK